MSSSSGDKCLICYEAVDPEKHPIAILGTCNHPGSVMHKKCLDRWLQVKRECPICRTRVRQRNVFSNLVDSSSSHSRSCEEPEEESYTETPRHCGEIGMAGIFSIMLLLLLGLVLIVYLVVK